MTVTLRPFATTSASAVLNGIVVATIVRRKAGYVVLGVDRFYPTMEDARLAVRRKAGYVVLGVDRFYPTMEDARLAVQARLVAQKLSR